MKYTEAIFNYRTDNNLTQKEVAKELNISVVSLSKYERNVTHSKKIDRKIEVYFARKNVQLKEVE